MINTTCFVTNLLFLKPGNTVFIFIYFECILCMVEIDELEIPTVRSHRFNEK